MSRFFRAAVLGTLLLAPLAAAQEEREVSGTVLDATDKPVAEASVASFWSSRIDEQDPQGSMSAIDGVKTDADGRFTMKVQFDDRPVALLAIDDAQRLGGITVVEPENAGTPVSIRLSPMIEVRGNFSPDDDGRPPDWTTVYIEHKPSAQRLLKCSSENGTFAFKLPPGEYSFDGLTPRRRIGTALTLTTDVPMHDMGTVDRRATVFKHKGRELPPWTISDACGVPKTVKYSDFKGKWVLLEFWGFW